MFKRFAQTGCLSLIGIVIGALVYIVFPGFDLEENVGLSWLFQQRGAVVSPKEVVVVAMDSKSAKQLSLSNDSKSWPRQLHAELINKLSAAGAQAIVFDVFFKEPKDPVQDQALADAIAQANNVILVASMQRELLELETPGEKAGHIVVDRLLSPASLFEQAAWATAPFVLPKVPARVNQFWTYYESAADTPTLPARALEHFSIESLPQLGIMLQEDDRPEVQALGRLLGQSPINKDTFTSLRRFVQQYPALTQEIGHQIETSPLIDGTTQQRLLALLKMYHHGGRYYLNFIGPPHSIKTYALSDIVDPVAASTKQMPDVAGKVVFVGFSERLQPQQRDSYYTVYTGESGSDISGVEIGATAFANLLHRNAIEPISPMLYVVLVVFSSLLVALTAWWLPATLAIVVVAIYVAAYISFCAYLFTHHTLWLPVVGPAFIQAPLILFAALVWRYALINRERKRIRKAFGYYLPDNVVNDLARQDGHVTASSQEMFGICLATDAQHYTSLAESLDPKTLSELMNRYYEALFAPVRSSGGVISDVIGDAMLAIWATKKTEAAMKQKACKTALEIIRSVEHFNETSGHPPLRTRIGLHAGQLVLGNIGALDHFEYRAVGDIVNTATRIESLNKKLGSTVLVSDEVLQDVDGFVTRQLGHFRMAGKQHPVVIHELLAFEEEHTPVLRDLCAQFQSARQAYENQQWEEAALLFKALIRTYPADAPSQFYYQRICNHLARPPQAWSAVISFVEK